MGGDALKSVAVKRMDANHYRLLSTKVVRALAGELPATRPHLLRSYATKPDFGDIDVIVDAAGLPEDVPAVLRSIFGSQEVFENVSRRNMAWSCDYLGYQVDIIAMSTLDYPTATVYYSDNDLGSLMGGVAHPMGFKYGHDGLSYRVHDGTRLIGEVNVSRDPARIFEFLGYTSLQYDYARFLRGFKTLAGIFNFAASSRFFRPEAYFPEHRGARRRSRDRSRKNYVAFVDWLRAGAVPPGVAAHLDESAHLVRAKILFPQFSIDLANLYERDARDRRRRELFNGRIVSGVTGVHGSELGPLIEFMKKNFEGGIDAFNAWVDQLPGPDVPDLQSYINAAHADFLTKRANSPAIRCAEDAGYN